MEIWIRVSVSFAVLGSKFSPRESSNTCSAAPKALNRQKNYGLIKVAFPKRKNLAQIGNFASGQTKQ